MRRTKIRVCTYALGLLFAASAGLPVAAKAEVPVIATVDLSHIRIDNFGQVDTGYYRGAQPTGTDYRDLAALGVKTVVDLQKDGDPGEQLQVERAGMTFYRIPMTTHEAPTTSQIDRFLRIVTDSANQPVYVHCAGGRHRTGVMSAVYRMENDGWSADRAFAEMKRYKFGMDFLHPEFKQFVYAYQPAGTLDRRAAIAAPHGM
jgi:tyrosine-protein phosphatase SIW14